MSKLEELFVPYQQSFDMKELEFNEPCFGHYLMKKYYLKDYRKQGNGIILRPTFSQCFEFFREKYGFFAYPNRTIGTEGIWYYFCIEPRTSVCEGSFIYEEAELTCLKMLINIVKNKKL